MDLDDCIKFATENPICFVATADGDQPRVRTLALWFASEGGFYFSVLSPKPVCRQLKANPKVEVCFYNHPSDLMQAKQMRVAGAVEFLDDEELQARAVEEGAWLDEFAGQPVGPLWANSRIPSGEAWFWTFAHTLKEEQVTRIRF